MDAKRARTGSAYTFQKEYGYIEKVRSYIKKEAHKIASEKIEKELSNLL